MRIPPLATCVGRDGLEPKSERLFVDELESPVREAVECTDDFDFPFFLHFLENGAFLADAGQGVADVVFIDALHEFRVGGNFLAREVLTGCDGGFDFREHGGDVAELHIVDGTFDGAAMLMSEDEDEFGPGNLACELHAAEEIFIDEVASDAAHKNISDALVEYIFHGNPAVEAAENHGLGKLSWGGLADLLAVIPPCLVAAVKAFIAIFELLQDFVRSEFSLLLGGGYVAIQRDWVLGFASGDDGGARKQSDGVDVVWLHVIERK